MTNNDQQPTNQEILQAINQFAGEVATKDDIANMATKDDLKQFAMKNDIKAIRSEMVTKDYLDNKLDRLEGHLVSLTRQEDTKLMSLVQILKNENVINEKHSNYLFSLKPFTQIKH